MIKTCTICGKEFEGFGTASHCPGPHYRVCPICNKQFEWDYKHPKECCSKKCSAALRKQTISSNTKICELCGKSFTPSSNTQRYCQGPHYNKCPVCGKLVLLDQDLNYMRCCSTECTNKLRKQTCLAKYGVAIVSQNADVKAKLQEAAFNSADARRHTSLLNWGVDNPAKHPLVRAKIAETVRSSECQQRMRRTTQQRYGVPYAMQSETGINRYVETIQNKYGVPYYCMTDVCKEAQGNIISSPNRALGKILKAADIRYEFEFRISDKSYDLHILDSNILLEINPTYTHNAVGNHWGPGLDKNYHRDKMLAARNAGYRCINIWDWDSLDKIIDLLQSTSPVYARKCIIKEIDRKTAETFEDRYHIQGRVRGQKVCLGLYHHGGLIQVMTFGKPRYNSKFEWELLRLCTDSRYAAVGGAERLWRYFIKHHSPESVISYCDLSKFSGEVYGRVGMSLDKCTEPNKVWSKGDKMITNNFLLQRGYDQIFNTNFGKGTSNEQLMLDNGWLPVYDCGQAVYTWMAEDSIHLPT